MKLSRRALLGALPALALAACGRPEAYAQVQAAPPLKSVAPFPVGSCVMTGELHDPAFAALLTRNFSQITPEWEMKMEYILQDDGSSLRRPDAIAALPAHRPRRSMAPP